jgi:hypothetical protein
MQERLGEPVDASGQPAVYDTITEEDKRAAVPAAVSVASV